MMVVMACALLLLTAAVVVLFAMVGEVASRVPATEQETHVVPYTDFVAGAVAAEWPGTLDVLADRHSATILVLSPICATCNKVAAELGDYQSEKLGDSLGVVISCSTALAGEDFIVQHSLGHLPHLVDEGGSWIHGNFGVNQSPTALRFHDGVLVEAFSFGKLEPLLGRISTVLEGVS